ncbi:MAG TPA: SRPBCC family protein [Nitrospiraceae bacterium]|jgi:uncharacterized membrane protein
MLTIEKSIEVNVPVGTAYHQWTQFEEFPRFMYWVKEVHQLDDRHLHWKVEIGGQEKEWVAEIIEQTPGRRILWTNQAGAINGGLVTFQSLSDTRSTVTLQLAYVPQSPLEHAEAGLEVLALRVEEDLERFKEFIESWGRTACPPIMR